MKMAEEIKKTKEHGQEKPLDKMTVKELRAIALECPRTTSVHDMKKEELIACIKEARGIKDEEPVNKRRDSAKLQTRLDLKSTIRNLKEEKISAREKKERKRVDFLRRRISRLKKQTRRIVST